MNPLICYCHGIEGFHGLAIPCNILVAVTVATTSATRTKRRENVPKVYPFRSWTLKQNENKEKHKQV